jgi:hypothetical protein
MKRLNFNHLKPNKQYALTLEKKMMLAHPTSSHFVHRNKHIQNGKSMLHLEFKNFAGRKKSVATRF